MGSVSLYNVVDLLTAAKIPAEPAFPAEQVARITAPAAAVSIQEVDPKTATTTFLVEVLAPKKTGGLACQLRAQDVCRALEAAGAVCRQGKCDFLARADVFRVPVEAMFYDLEKVTVKAGGHTLPYAVGFSADQVRTSGTTNMLYGEWDITLEEFFPWGVLNTVEASEPFALEIRCAGQIERYENCRWTRWRRISEKTGIRQLRTGEAQSRTLTTG